MTEKENQPRRIETGGGAYVAGSVRRAVGQAVSLPYTGVAGSVRVEGGDFVGRDKTVVRQVAQGITVEDFLRLLAQLRETLPTAGLNPEIAQVIEADVRAVEEQARREEPRGAIILAKLQSVAELLGAAGTAATGVSRLAPLVQQAIQWAQQLFHR